MNRRVLGAVGIVIGILLGGFVYITLTGAFARFQDTWVEESLRSRLEVLAQATAQSLLAWLVQEDDLEASRILQDLVARNEGIYQAILIDRDDRVFAVYPERNLSPGETFVPSQPALRQTSLGTVFGRLERERGRFYMMGVPVVMNVQGQSRRVGALYLIVTDSFVSQSSMQAYGALRGRVTTITLGAFGVLLLILLGMVFAAGGEGVPSPRPSQLQGLIIYPSDSPEHLQEVRKILPPPPSTEAVVGSYRITLQTPETGVVIGARPFWAGVGIGKRDASHLAAMALMGRMLKERLPESAEMSLSEWMGLLELALDFMDITDPSLVMTVGRADGGIEILSVGEVIAFTVSQSDPDMAGVVQISNSAPRFSLALAQAVDEDPLRLDASTMGVVLAAFPDAVTRANVDMMVRNGTASVGEVENLVNENAFGWVLSLEREG